MVMILITFCINIFLSLQLSAADVSECGAGVYCQIPGEYRPALVFGAGTGGIQSLRQGVSENEDLITDILRYQLTTNPDSGNEETVGNRLIASSVNKSYNLGAEPFAEPIELAAIGYILNPELFSSTESTAAQLTRITYPERTVGGDTFSGVKLDNFTLDQLDFDFSQFSNPNSPESRIKICGHIKLDINTSLRLNLEAEQETYDVGIENIDLSINTEQSEKLCFNAAINMSDFSITTLERIGDVNNVSFKIKRGETLGLIISVPNTTPLSSLGQNDLNNIAKGYLSPVLAERRVAQMIEAPIITNVRDILSEQLNTIVAQTLSNQNPSIPEISLPMANISNSSITTSINGHIDGLTALNGRNNCGELINRMNNISYWVRQNPSYSDSATANRLSQYLSTMRAPNQRCLNKREYNLAINGLRAIPTRITPSEDETEQMIIRQLTQLGDDGSLEVEVFIPELCHGNYTSALAGREPPASCNGFYSMLDLSYVNNYLADQISKGNVCQTSTGGRCGIRMMDEENTDEDQSEERPRFSCSDMESIGISGMGGSNMRATVSLRDCQSNGKSSMINLGLWRLGRFDNTDIQMNYDVELSRRCTNGKPVCFKINFRDDLFNYQGGLEDASLEGSITDALKEEMAKLEDTFNEVMNGFPIEDFTAGLNVTELFGEGASETSSGHVGACLELDRNNGSTTQICRVAANLLPANHPGLRRCQ